MLLSPAGLCRPLTPFAPPPTPPPLTPSTAQDPSSPHGTPPPSRCSSPSCAPALNFLDHHQPAGCYQAPPCSLPRHENSPPPLYYLHLKSQPLLLRHHHHLQKSIRFVIRSRIAISLVIWESEPTWLEQRASRLRIVSDGRRGIMTRRGVGAFHDRLRKSLRRSRGGLVIRLNVGLQVRKGATERTAEARMVHLE